MPSAVKPASFSKKKTRKKKSGEPKKTVGQGVRKVIKIRGKKRRFKALTPAQMLAIQKARRASAIKRKGKANFSRKKK